MILWDKWGTPYGRVGPSAYLMEGQRGEVYLGEGRRVWRLVGSLWESIALLPGEGRVGTIDAEGRLWIVGLNGVYIREGSHIRTLPLPQAGWGEAIWTSPSGIGIRGATQSFWIPRAKDLTAYPLPGTLIGVEADGLWIQRKDTILKGHPNQWQVAFRCAAPLQRLVWVNGEGWGLTNRGELYRITPSGLLKAAEGVRMLSAGYYLTGNQVYSLRDTSLLWRSEKEVYGVFTGRSGDVVWVLTGTEVVGLYPKVQAGWRHTFSSVLTSWKKDGERWVAWQGEMAYYPEKKSMRRYASTLIEAAYAKNAGGSAWVWATPRGLIDEEGHAMAEPGYYIKSVAAQGARLAYAVGKEVVLQEPSGQKYRYAFPMAVQGVGYAGDEVWVWGGAYVYRQTKGTWQGEKVEGFIEEGRIWERRLCVRVGSVWLWRRGAIWDTLSQAPWLRAALPVSASWGSLLAAWQTGKKRYLLLSHGLIEIADEPLQLPPIQLKATLVGPGLNSLGGNKYAIPAERAYVSLKWEVIAPFLPGYALVYYRVGEEAPLLAEGREILLSLPPEGEMPIRLSVSHPWYPGPLSQEWVIQVIPPWYKTTYARIGGAVLLLLLIGGGIALREWYHRQLRRQLAAERAALARQVQQQQTQILQNERMANLGVMAAHIAHEINTPLGIIQSALTEAERRLSALRPPLIRPAQPPQSPTDRRHLFQAWQKAHPELPPYLFQQLATLGYTPAQWPDLSPYLEKPETLQTWLSWIEAETYLSQVRTATEKLQERVQRIRTYVREIRESTEKSRFTLQESLLRTIEFYKPLLRRVQVETQWPSEPIWVEGDPARLDQVWANLIQNAIQAMPPEKGRLRIEIQVEEGQALVLIQDNGHGIPPEIQERIFDPLFTTKAPGEGTGLGLPICRQISEMHGGQLKLLHSEPGYTLFGVQLPMAPASTS